MNLKRKLLFIGLLITLGFIFITAVGIIVSDSSNTIYGIALAIAMLIAIVLLIILRRK